MVNIVKNLVLRAILKLRNDRKEKHAIYKLYAFTKNDTIAADQMNHFYTTKTKTFRWAALAFYEMLDVIRVNSKSL